MGSESEDVVEPSWLSTSARGWHAGAKRAQDTTLAAIALTSRHGHETRWIASPSGFKQWRWGTE